MSSCWGTLCCYDPKDEFSEPCYTKCLKSVCCCCYDNERASPKPKYSKFGSTRKHNDEEVLRGLAGDDNDGDDDDDLVEAANLLGSIQSETKSNPLNRTLVEKQPIGKFPTSKNGISYGTAADENDGRHRASTDRSRASSGSVPTSDRARTSSGFGAAIATGTALSTNHNTAGSTTATAATTATTTASRASDLAPTQISNNNSGQGKPPDAGYIDLGGLETDTSATAAPVPISVPTAAAPAAGGGLPDLLGPVAAAVDDGANSYLEVGSPGGDSYMQIGPKSASVTSAEQRLGADGGGDSYLEIGNDGDATSTGDGNNDDSYLQIDPDGDANTNTAAGMSARRADTSQMDLLDNEDVDVADEDLDALEELVDAKIDARESQLDDMIDAMVDAREAALDSEIDTMVDKREAVLGVEVPPPLREDDEAKGGVDSTSNSGDGEPVEETVEAEEGQEEGGLTEEVGGDDYLTIEDEN